MLPTRRSVVMALCLFAAALPALASDLTISSFRVRGPSGGNDEFVELHNGSGTAIGVSGYTLLGSNDSGTTGTRATLATGTSIGPGCYLLLTNAGSNGYSGSVSGDVTYKRGVTDTGGLAVADGTGGVIDQIGLSNGSAYGEGSRLASLGSTNADRSYAQVVDAAGNSQDSGDNAADFALQSPSTPHNAAGICSHVGLSVSVADASANEGDSGTTLLNFTLTLTQPAPTLVQVRLHTVDGTATVADGDYEALDQVVTFAAGDTEQKVGVIVRGDTRIEPNENFSVQLSDPSNGLSVARGDALGGILNDNAVQAEIFRIQGSGDSSPFAGQPVITRNNIVTSVGPAGFTMQTPDRRDDRDRMTSNGVYVFTGSAPKVAIGDAVDVHARVTEYYGLTELTQASVSVPSHGQRRPAPVVFGSNVPSTDPVHLSCGSTNFEYFEGMRILVFNGIVDRANQRYSSDSFAEVFVSAGGKRSLRSQGVPFGVTPSDIHS